MAARLEAMGTSKYQGLTRKSGDRYVWTGRVVQDEKALAAPLTWKKSRIVFVNSMSDLFHPAVETAFIAKVWAVMRATPQHTYQVLTKRRDDKLVALVAEAKQARQLILASPDQSIAAIAASHGRCRTRLGKLGAMSCLAPDIVTAIVEGRQPAMLTARTLQDIDLPLAWTDQRALLGFN